MSVQDLATDAYGKHVASCSSDGSVQIYSVNGKELTPVCTLPDGHGGVPVNCVAWAHPRFPGAILASCSQDVVFWKETENTTARWTKVYSHRMSGTIHGAAWGPHEFGLVFACAACDGTVQLLRSVDLQQWNVTSFVAHRLGCNAVSWSPFMAPGSLSALPLQAGPQTHPLQPVQRLVTCGNERSVKIWKWVDADAHWLVEHELLDCASDVVMDVAWAPNYGLPFTYIAACGNGGVSIWSQDGLEGKWHHRVIPEFDGSNVGRVTWSHLGTILGVSTCSGTTTLWKEDSATGEWKEVSQVA